MKKVLFTVLALVMFGLQAVGQDTCFFQNGLIFQTQTDVNAFPSTYPTCKVIDGGLFIFANPGEITNLDSLYNIQEVLGRLIIGTSGLKNLKGLDSLEKITEALTFSQNDSLSSLKGLENLAFVGETIRFVNNPSLKHFDFSPTFKELQGDLIITTTENVDSIFGFENFNTIKGSVIISWNSSFEYLNILKNLEEVHGDLKITSQYNLSFISELNNLNTIKGKLELSSTKLKTLKPFSHLDSLGKLFIYNNDSLTSLQELENIQIVSDSIYLIKNENLESCNLDLLCTKLKTQPDKLIIYNNGLGCQEIDVIEYCNGKPISVYVTANPNGDCTFSPFNHQVEQAKILLIGEQSRTITGTDRFGISDFFYFEPDSFLLILTNYPNQFWEACDDTIKIDLDSFPQSSIFTQFYLTPKVPCPNLDIDIAAPSNFRGCLTTSNITFTTQNTGTIPAENTQTTLILPSVVEVISSTVPITSQSNDTLYFDHGDLNPFEIAEVKLTVKTDCDTFLLGQTLCIEAFATMDNPCDELPIGSSEIRATAKCLSDTAVALTLTNIGDAPTLATHDYIIIEDELILRTENFMLNANESKSDTLSANGSTFRMEATKLNDGTRTAVALEGCGGLNPGLINAYWLDEGDSDYDIECREVIGSYDPNQKTAIPTGVGTDNLFAKNRPIQYTIDFQNTGTDTAFRVLLQDILSPNLDVNSFRPVFASHDYDWEIKGDTLLEVLFFPIKLPDSTTNQAESQGFFTYTINQKQDLANGIMIENTAEIIFDFNPPIITNTVYHTIGELMVSADEPQQHKSLWKVWGNPTKTQAIFSTTERLRGISQFELYDTMGKHVLSTVFSGQSHTFERNGLGSGVYFFKITDSEGRAFTGKIVVVD